MSVQTTRAKTDRCALPECRDTFSVLNAVEGSYCSRDCYDRHRGRKLLRNIRHDHRFCWSCWKSKKTLEQPTEEYRNRHFQRSESKLTRTADGDLEVERVGQEVSRDAVVGHEHHTRHVRRGPHGLECDCDAVSHDIDDWDRRGSEPYHWRLKRIVDQLREEGQDSRRFDIATFAEVLWQTGKANPGTGGFDGFDLLEYDAPPRIRGDLELAVGRALD